MVNARMLDRRRQRVQRVGTLVLCLTALLASGWLIVQAGKFSGQLLFSRNPLYTVAHFEISSDGRRIPPALILEFAQLQDGINLFSMNLNEVRGRLEEVSLVHHALVQRVLPDTLKIRITERVAVARLGSDNSRYPLAIDRFGVVLGRKSRAPSLPMITGVDFVMSGPIGKQLRPGRRVTNPAILDAVQVINMCDEDTRLARALVLERIDVSEEDVLWLYLPGEGGDPSQSRKAKVGRGEDMEKLVKDLAATLQYANAIGRNYEDFNFSVRKNQAVQ